MDDGEVEIIYEHTCRPSRLKFWHGEYNFIQVMQLMIGLWKTRTNSVDPLVEPVNIIQILATGQLKHLLYNNIEKFNLFTFRNYNSGMCGGKKSRKCCTPPGTLYKTQYSTLLAVNSTR